MSRGAAEGGPDDFPAVVAAFDEGHARGEGVEADEAAHGDVQESTGPEQCSKRLGRGEGEGAADQTREPRSRRQSSVWLASEKIRFEGSSQMAPTLRARPILSG